MAKYRIKAYFIHENEEMAAKEAVNNSTITGAEWTPSFIMGVVDEDGITSLRKSGLVVSIIEKVDAGADAQPARHVESIAASIRLSLPGEIGTSGLSTANGGIGRPLPVTIENQPPNSKVLQHDSRRTQFYVVRFHGPITEERRNALRKAKIELIERLSSNKYTVRLKPSQVKPLSDFPFVDCLRLYTEADTLRVRNAPGFPLTDIDAEQNQSRATATMATNARKRLPRTIVFTVKLHLSRDMPVVVNWLAKHKIKTLWKHGDQLQIALVENEKALTHLAKLPEVAIIEPLQTPRLFDEPARILLGLIRADAKLDLEGEGEIIGVADTGIDTAHPDLTNRIKGTIAWGRPGDVSDPEGHGTHVAGCAVGDGTASSGEVMGAAPQAKVFFQSILDFNGGLGGLPNDIGDLLEEAYAQGVRVHNNSWGAFSFARYSNTSFSVDRFVAANPDMLVIIAAGNDGIGIPRVLGSKMNAKKGFVDWPCVAAPATAKNGLAVGASRSSRTTGGYSQLTWNDAWPDRYPHQPISQECISSNDQCLAAFSSRGPCDDLRIKPDVVAPGTDIAAAKSKDAPLFKFWGAFPNNKHYGFMGGTSMAAPYVAGCAALVREWYRKKGNWATPSAALLKATLINGTKRITGIDAIAEVQGDPNFHQGFGRIDMSNTVPSPLSPQLRLAYEDTWKDSDQVLKRTGELFCYRLDAGNAMPLRICLAWTDPEARGLQNSLLLLVENPAKKKWVGNDAAATLLNVAGGPRDPNNNVQVVRIAKPEPGEYTIAIIASMVFSQSQSFALVATGDLQSDLIRR
jgi:serine protease AprX